MNRIKFISVQPDNDYFLWQIQVQMNNFKRIGIEKDAVILFAYNPEIGINTKILRFKNKTSATIIFIKDERKDKSYISSIRPYILKMFYKNYSHVYKGYHLFYHDSDILFNELPNFKDLLKRKGIILSDTISYIGAKYIMEKGEELFNEMCEIVKINPEIVINNEYCSGGAQYLFNKKLKLGYEFWDKVESDSVLLYNHMIATSNKYNPEHPIQAWTSDMWALLWNIWLLNYKTEISDELNFSWATMTISEWSKNNIYHNAGVTNGMKDLFFKGKYIEKSPFSEDFSYVSKDFCSIKYVEEIISTRDALNLGN